MRESHIDIDAGIGHYHIKNELQNKGLDRNILIRLPSYLGVGLVVQETDAIATVPYYLSQVLLVRETYRFYRHRLIFQLMMLSNIGICLVTTRVAINGSVKPVMNYLKLLKSFNYKKKM